MKKSQQKQFIKELSRNIESELLGKLSRAPENWDGHELRVWMAEKYAESGRMSVISNEPRTARARDYRNTIITQNL